jgi:hypothetical protein
MTTGWESKHVIDGAYELAEELGFQLDRHPAYNMERICLLVADENEEGIWASDVVLEAFNSFEEARAFLAGYAKCLMYNASKRAKK